MDEPDDPRTTPCEGDSEKRNARTEEAPAIVLFKSEKLMWTASVLILCNKLFLLLADRFVLGLITQAMSDFSESAHSVLSILPIVIGISSGVLRLPMAKYIDEAGRCQGFALAFVITSTGLVILALSKSLAATVSGQIAYGIGSACVDFILTVILADMTSLKNRALIYGIYAIPIIPATLAARGIAQSSLATQTGYRSIVGICSGILSVVNISLSCCIFPRAHARLWDKDEESDSTATTEELPGLRIRKRRFAVELDIPGVILPIAGICLFLLALGHIPGTQDGWSWSIFSAVLVPGVLSLSLLSVWEKHMAPVTCLPGSLMRNRNILGGCGVAMLTAASIACWSSYYSSYSQVVHDQTIIAADNVAAARALAFACSAPLIGLILRKFGTYKRTAMLAGPQLPLVTVVLLCHFHERDAWPFLEILIGIVESTLILCSQMAVMDSVDHKNVAMALGIWGTCLSIAVAIGHTGATAVWTNGLPRALKNALPTDSKTLTTELLRSLEKQKQYPLGSPIRDALVAAYGVAQQHVLTMATCLAILAPVCLVAWRNINLRERKDVQGARAKGVIW